MENIFVKAFEADDYSRSDISADAGKGGVGIGLKTFLQQNGRTFQKVAEFNRESYLLQGMSPWEIIHQVALMRNERIESTMRICNVQEMMYHLVTRSKNQMAIYEEPMDLIDLNSLQLTKDNPTTIQFKDRINEYTFNKSKSTLLKRFETDNKRRIMGFKVNILADPFEFLLNRKEDVLTTKASEDVVDFIVLPLYSPRSQLVEKQSGLNQWNAGGRRRDVDEVYIPIPAWVHRNKMGFFTYNTDDHKTDKFNVKLPGGEIVPMKVAQQGGKALMSDPNLALGKWILRDVLRLPPKTLVTRKKLDILGIDSVKLSKMRDGTYALDFLHTGSYEEFKEQNI